MTKLTIIIKIQLMLVMMMDDDVMWKLYVQHPYCHDDHPYHHVEHPYHHDDIHSKNWIRWILESADNLEFSAERFSENAKNVNSATC